MAFFEWKADYETGIGGIDEQHRRIVGLMNELFEAIRSGRADDVMKGIYVELLRYANYHFCLELKLFQKYHYADERRHIEEHNSFIRKVETLLINDFVAEKNHAIDTLHFLRSWFQEHMMKTDMEYCAFFRYKEIMAEIDEYIAGEGQAGLCD